MIFIIIVIVVILILYNSKRKSNNLSNLGNLIIIKGGTGSGKTLSMTYLALKEYKKRRLGYKIRKIFNKKIESPILYSNYPIYINKRIGWSTPITSKMILTKYPIAEKSVICFSEIGNTFPQWTFQDKDIREHITIWFSQARHFFDSMIFIDTQSKDMIFNGIHRSASNNITCLGTLKFKPLFFIVKYYRNESIDTTITEDNVNENSSWILIPYSVIKKYRSRFNRYSWGEFKITEFNRPKLYQSFYVKEMDRIKK